MIRARLLAVAQALAVVVAGSLAGVLAKHSLEEVAGFTFVWLQIGIGLVLLSAFTFGVRRQRWPRGLRGREWLHVALLGIGNFTVVRVMFLLALERLPASTQTFLVSLVNFVTMALSVVMLGERPTRLQWLGCVLAVGGVWVFFEELPAPDEVSGLVFVSVGILALAFTNNLARKLGVAAHDRLPTQVLSTLALWFGGLPVVLCGLYVDGWPALPAATHWWIIAANAVVGIAIGLTVWNHVLRTLHSYEASLLGVSSVIFVALFAVPILGEHLAIRQIGGIALLLAGVALAQLRR